MNRNARPMTIDEIRSSEKAAQTAREAAEKQIKQENRLFQEEIRKKQEKEIKEYHKKQEKLLMQLCREKGIKHSKDMNTVITIWDFVRSHYPAVVDRIRSDMRELGCEVQLDDEGYPRNDLKWVFLFRPDMLKYIKEHEDDLFCKSENH